MDNKIDLADHMLCSACLCVGRLLCNITNAKLKQYYLDTLNEIPLASKVTSCPLVCWECESLLRKTVSFREQVKDSYRILQTYTSDSLQECLLTDVTRPPRLKINSIETLNITPQSETNQLNIKPEMQVVFVKDEKRELDYDDDSNQTSPLTIVDESSLDNYDDYVTGLKTELKDILRDDDKHSNTKKKKSKNGSIKVKKAKKSVKAKERSDVKASKTRRGLLADVTRPLILKTNSIETLKINPQSETNQLNIKPEMQVVFVKDEKRESDNDDDFISNSPHNILDENSFDNYENDVTALETELKDILRDDDKHGNTKKKKSKNGNVKVKKKAKEKEINNGKASKGPKISSKKVAQKKVLTIELSYEEMLAERAKESEKETYLKAEYKCDSCLITFNYEISYREHVNNKHSKDRGEYSCPVCNTVMASVDSFTAHYKRHMRRYECTVCGKRTMDRKVMQQHYDSTHGDVGRDMSNTATPRCNKVKQKSRVECKECDKTFCHRAGLMNHRLAVHKLNNQFPCMQCSKVFRWKTSLKKHMEKHDRKGKPPEAVARCVQCDVTFTSVCSYQRHLRTSLGHVTRDQLKFICDDCGRRYSNKTKLRDHIEEKHLLRRYQCRLCHKLSKNRVCLEQHVRNVHTGRALTRICHHCGRGFPTKVQLESHIRSHTGERPFICEICPTTFSQQSNLYKHNRQVHLNIKSKRQTPRKKESPLFSTQTENVDTNVINKNITILYPTNDKNFVI